MTCHAGRAAPQGPQKMSTDTTPGEPPLKVHRDGHVMVLCCEISQISSR
ncbi:hypothetical protein [Mycobacterium sp. MUNTM1]